MNEGSTSAGPPSPVTQWRIAVRESGLPSTARLACFVLSTYMNSDGECWPAIATIAAGCGLGKRAVQYALGEAEAYGLLEKTEQAGMANVYRASFGGSNRFPELV